MEFFIFIAIVVAFFQIVGLKKRVKKLEELSGEKKPVQSQMEAGKTNLHTDTNYDHQRTYQEPVVQAQSNSQLDREPDFSARLSQWLKEDWMLKLGALLILIGLGWLTSYAFLNDWIGPVGRITIGILLGLALIILGWWRLRRFIHQGSVFLVTGSTVILITVFAARSIYGFFTPMTALALMFLSTIFVAVAALKYNNRALALASICLAGVAPLLTASQFKDTNELFFYLLVVTVGTIWMVFITGRRELTVAALVIVALYSLPYLGNSEVLTFVYIFAAIFFLANMFSIIKLRGEDISSDVAVAGGNSLFLITWILAATGQEWKSLTLVAWMLFFILGAFLVFKFTKKREPFYVYTGVSILLLAIATAVEFDGFALFYAYLIEALFITLGSYMLSKKTKVALPFSLSLLVPVFLSLDSISRFDRVGSLLDKDFFVILITGVSLVALGYFFKSKYNPMDKKEEKLGSSLMLIGGSVYLYILLWSSLHAMLYDDSVAVIVALFIYTVLGVFFYFHGIKKDIRALTVYGGIMVGLVMARLFLVDIWRMDLTGKIIVFFLVGTLLISTAFIKRKKPEAKITSNY